MYYKELLFIISTISIIYPTLVTIRETDLKRIIAYSSIGHMGIVIQSIICEEISGLKGGCITMVTHGLVSPGLFLISNYIYSIYGTRNINYISGISGNMPIIGISAM
jgi:NADH-ubiquinone oxidoreductase chain 4